MSLKIPIFLVLDMDSPQEALSLAEKLSPYVGGFKVGPQLLLRSDNTIVKTLSELGQVFLDMKFYDIPNTMKAAIRSSFDMGATYATIHASCGSQALRELSALEAELNKQREFRLLAVTVLTSFSQETLPPSMRGAPIATHVERLAQESLFHGIRGLVCSPQEAHGLRHKFPQAFIVTPGIRRPQDDQGDQSRTMGPGEAIRSGASALVVGRPITQAADPVQAAKEIYEDVQASLST